MESVGDGIAHQVPKGSGNNTHIGVEMCEPASIRYTGGSSFTCSNLSAARTSVKENV